MVCASLDPKPGAKHRMVSLLAYGSSEDIASEGGELLVGSQYVVRSGVEAR